MQSAHQQLPLPRFPVFPPSPRLSTIKQHHHESSTKAAATVPPKSNLVAAAAGAVAGYGIVFGEAIPRSAGVFVQ